MILSWEVNNIISCQFFSRHAKQMLNIDQSGHGFLSQSNSGSFVFVADITKYLYVVESFWRRLMRLRYFIISYWYNFGLFFTSLSNNIVGWSQIFRLHVHWLRSHGHCDYVIWHVSIAKTRINYLCHFL